MNYEFAGIAILCFIIGASFLSDITTDTLVSPPIPLLLYHSESFDSKELCLTGTAGCHSQGCAVCTDSSCVNIDQDIRGEVYICGKYSSNANSLTVYSVSPRMYSSLAFSIPGALLALFVFYRRFSHA